MNTDFTSKVLCVALRTSCLGTTSTDEEATEDLAKRNNASTRQINATRKILSHREKGSHLKGIAPMLKIRQRARALLRRQTFPGLTGDLRIIVPSRISSLTAAIEDLQVEDNLAVQNLINNWESELEYDASPLGLGSRFDPTLYPPKEHVASMFELSLTVTDFPRGDFTRFGLIAEELQAQHNATIEEIGRQARNEIRAQLAERIRHILDKTSNPDVEKWHASTFDNLRKLLDLVPTLNITDDPLIEEIRLDCWAKLDVHVESIKQSEFLRASVASDAKAILAKLGGTGRKILAA